MTEDEQVFGENAWIYCRDHMKPHKTGWCTVPAAYKIGLGVSNTQESYEKTREFDLPIYGETKKASRRD